MRHPRKIDENLRKAQEARRVLDRLVGYDLSGLIWKKSDTAFQPAVSNPPLFALSRNANGKSAPLSRKIIGQ